MRQRLTRHALTHRPHGRGAQASLLTCAKLAANVPPCVCHPSRNPAPAARVCYQGRQACQLVGIGHRQCHCGYRGQVLIETGDPSVRCDRITRLQTGVRGLQQIHRGHGWAQKHRRKRRTLGLGAAFNSTTEPSIDAAPHDRWGHQDTGKCRTSARHRAIGSTTNSSIAHAPHNHRARKLEAQTPNTWTARRDGRHNQDADQ